MNIRRFLPLLPILIACGALKAQPASPGAIRALVQAWGRGQIRADRPTVLFATSIHQCSGCCATAVNVLSRRIRAAGLDANTLVVVAADAKGEGIMLRDQFAADAVAEDLDGKLASTLAAHEGSPDMYLISPSGQVLRRVRDIQHNNDIGYRELAAAGLRPVPPPLRVVAGRSASLREPKGVLFVDTETPALLADGSIAFMDSHGNVLYQYDLRSGAMLRRIDPDSMKFRFRKSEDNPAPWDGIDTAYVGPMVPFEGIVNARDADTLLAFADFFTGYHIDTLDAATGRVRFMMERNRALLGIRDGKVESVRQLPEMPYVMVGRPALIGRSTIASPALVMAYLEGEKTRADSAYAFVLLDRERMTYTMAANLGEIEKGYGHEFAPMLEGKLVPAGDSTFIYINEGNRALFAVDLRAPGRHRPIAPAGTLLQLMASPRGADSAIRDSIPDLSEEITVLDIASDSSSFHVLLEDNRIPSRRERMVVQRYAFDGTLLGEHRVRSRDDLIVTAHLAGVWKGELVALVKWKRGRWTIERIPVR